MAKRPSTHRKIATELRAAILSGHLPQGAVLPSERELIERYGTTKGTASKAIAILQGEGLVRTEFDRGTFVRDMPPLRRISAARRHATHRNSGKPIFDAAAIEQGQVPTRRMLHVGRIPAPPDAAPARPPARRARGRHLAWDVDHDDQERALQAASDIYAADRHEFAYEWNEEDIPG